VVHGDDITSDSNGEDCYRYVKAAGRFLVVKRTPGISTTDLVGRMLLFTRGHFIKSLTGTLAGEEGPGTPEERREAGDAMEKRIHEYASDETGLQPGSQVWTWAGSRSAMENNEVEEAGIFKSLVSGKSAKPGQRIIYVDGGFDLFSSGHIEFLRQVLKSEEAIGQKSGWYDPQRQQKRLKDHGEDFGPAYIVAGVHDDYVINRWKGLNYPIMNIFERGLCVLQCRVSLSPNFQMSLVLTAAVCSLSNILSAFHANRSISSGRPYWPTTCGISWPNDVHASYIRPV
jgi:ethanolamine-phosphate cytidylyltransferase